MQIKEREEEEKKTSVKNLWDMVVSCRFDGISGRQFFLKSNLEPELIIRCST